MGIGAEVFFLSESNDIGKRRVGHIVKAAAAAAAIIAAAPASAAWEPTKPVEIVVAAGAGGASDQMARMMQAAIQKNNLMKQPIVVSLKGGASGAVFHFDSANQTLYFSADGTQASAITVATLQAGATLTAQDLLIV